MLLPILWSVQCCPLLFCAFAVASGVPSCPQVSGSQVCLVLSALQWLRALWPRAPLQPNTRYASSLTCLTGCLLYYYCLIGAARDAAAAASPWAHKLISNIAPWRIMQCDCIWMPAARTSARLPLLTSPNHPMLHDLCFELVRFMAF